MSFSLRTPLLILLLVFSHPVGADEVVLIDGTRIVGRVKTLDAGRLTIVGETIGELHLPFSRVLSITTDEDREVVLADGSARRVRFELRGESVEIVGATGREPVSLAQVQAIDPPPPEPPVTHEGNITLSGKVTDGNTRQKKVTANAEYVRRTKENRLTVLADWNYAQDFGELTERNASLRGKVDHFFDERLFTYANASGRRDDFADLDLRSTLGAGAGYQLLDSDTCKYYEELGISYVDDRFDVAEDDDYATARFSGKLDWAFDPDRVTIFHFHEVFLGLEDTDDLLVDTQSGVRLTLLKDFYASIQLNYKWDNTPAEGKRREDVELLLGLGYSYTF